MIIKFFMTLDMRTMKPGRVDNRTMICINKITRDDLRYFKAKWRLTTYDEVISKLIAESEIKTFY